MKKSNEDAEGQFQIGKMFFTKRLVTAPSLSELKEIVDDALSHMVQF